MARLVTKFKFIKPDDRKSVGGYAKYIATREGVDKIDDSQKHQPATQKQKEFIQKLLRDFPDAKDSLEYEDYTAKQTIGSASEFISRTVEENTDQMMDSKTYADYIATRPRAQRFGSHGLFTDDGVAVNLKKVSEELNQHDGNVWTAIVSLRREDAARLGFDHGERWRDMLRTQTEALATNLNIPMQNLRWFAAFHNESHHPHVHMIVYSTEHGEGYLSKKGVNNLRSSLAKDIFAQDLLCVYEQQTEQRDALKVQSREIVAGIIEQINSGVYDNPTVENLLLSLADRLSKTSGKKVYGYLKADVKGIVDSIVEEFSKDKRIAALYDLWYQKREEILRTYTEDVPPRLPLSENKEFKSVRNMVITEAMNIVADRQVVEDAPETNTAETDITEPPSDPAEEPTEPDTPNGGFDSGSSGSGRSKNSWWSDGYKKARHFLYGSKTEKPDFTKALALMQSETAKGNGFAMHDIGKMHLVGMGCAEDEKAAQEWFTKAYNAFIQKEAVSEKKDYLQYRIGKLYSFGYGVEQSYEKAAEWYEKSLAANNPFAAYSLGSLYRRGQGVEQSDERAFSLYMQAATHEQKPNAYAQYELGRMYADGIGTAKNPSKSAYWYKEAYNGFLEIVDKMPDDKLYYRLGRMNLNGIGTAVNLEQAKFYFEKSAECGNADALYGLGKLYLNKDFSEYNVQAAVKHLEAAAQKDHAFAQCSLGRLFYKGEQVPQHLPCAVAMLEKAVAQENEPAEYLLGKILLQPDTEFTDTVRAEKLLTKAAEAGNEYAAYTLGKAYLDGLLLPMNIQKAIALLTQAADKDFAPALYTLGKLFYHGEVVPRDIPRAVALLEKAVEQGNPYAAYLAGKIRLTEDSVKDADKAIRHLLFAAENGNNYAEYQLGKLFLYGKDVERDYDRAISYLTAAAEHGSQYAAQLLHSIRSNRNFAAALGSLRLLGDLSRLIQRRMDDDRNDKNGAIIDRKIRRQTEAKKQAHGQKMG